MVVGRQYDNIDADNFYLAQENRELRDTISYFRAALEDIASGDETSTVDEAVAIAKEALARE